MELRDIAIALLFVASILVDRINERAFVYIESARCLLQGWCS